MTHRERMLAVLRYEPYDRLPLVHFGYWTETLVKWAGEGHISREQAEGWADGNPVDSALAAQLGFDFDFGGGFAPALRLYPCFEREVVAEFPDGTLHVRDRNGAVIVEKPGCRTIPAEIGHLLKDRASWEEHYKWRLAYAEERVTKTPVRVGDDWVPYDQGGLEYLRAGEWEEPLLLSCGSLYGQIRDILGLEGSAYVMADDEPLMDEIINAVGDMSFRVTERVLKDGGQFDYAHFWEDICFKNGPLISPRVFAEKVGPHYKRITDLLLKYGIDLVSLDCDGCIDALLPIWLENGVNVMFPIEVGTWNASIGPWRERYGKAILGVGGMDKRVFAHDRAAVDAEVERLKPLVELGGYIPCPDHRIPPDAQWDLVRYYCERMRQVFG